MNTQVTVNALHPGTVNTELTRDIGHITVLFSKYIVKPFLFLFFKTAKAGAQTSIYAGMNWYDRWQNSKFQIHCIFPALDPKLENVSGQYFR